MNPNDREKEPFLTDKGREMLRKITRLFRSRPTITESRLAHVAEKCGSRPHRHPLRDNHNRCPEDQVAHLDGFRNLVLEAA